MNGNAVVELWLIRVEEEAIGHLTLSRLPRRPFIDVAMICSDRFI